MSDKKSGITALIIMDGFGVPADVNRSAILEENTKNIQELAKKYPNRIKIIVQTDCRFCDNILRHFKGG